MISFRFRTNIRSCQQGWSLKRVGSQSAARLGLWFNHWHDEIYTRARLVASVILGYLIRKLPQIPNIHGYNLPFFLVRAIFPLQMESPAQPSCENCGEPFSPYRHWQRFCSPPCRSQHYSRYVRHSCADALRVLDTLSALSDLVTEENEKREKSPEGGV